MRKVSDLTGDIGGKRSKELGLHSSTKSNEMSTDINGNVSDVDQSSAYSNSVDNAELAQLYANIYKLAKYGSILLLAYLTGYFGINFCWVIFVGIFFFIKDQHKEARRLRFEVKNFVSQNEKEILAHLPTWVIYPDAHRGDWINDILKQIWPYFTEYMITFLKTSVEASVREYLKGFHFESITFGTVPFKIGSIKSYDNGTKKEQIFFDIQIIYVGNCEIQCRVKGFKGGIKEIHFKGDLRVELNPLIKDLPLVACVSVYFLRNPELEMNLTNLADILDFPGLNDHFQKFIMKEFAKQLVLPNKKYFTLVDNYQAKKIVEPTGVIRLEVIEAHNLLKSDVGLFGMGKSDPYVDIRICNQDFRTPTISNTINPKWNYMCEGLIYGNAYKQKISMQVLDEDKGSKDDFLGEIEFKIETIAKQGIVDARLNLLKTITGQIHFKATWLGLSRSKFDVPSNTPKIKTKEGDHGCAESKACIFIYLDSAKNVPSVNKMLDDPSSQVILTFGKDRQKSKVISLTSNPVWEEHFHFMIDQFSALQELQIEIIETNKNAKIGSVNISMQSLMDTKDMSFLNPMFTNKYCDNFNVFSTIQLYFLKPSLVKDAEMIWDEEVKNKQTDTLPTLENLVLNSVDVMAKTGGISDNIIELSQNERQHMKSDSNSQSFSTMEINWTHQEDYIEVIINQMTNLPEVNNSQPTTFVQLIIIPEYLVKDKIFKTSTKKNSCNPVFRESFKIDLNEHLESIKFVAWSISSKSFYKKTKKMIGYVEIFFNHDLFDKNVSFTKTFEIEKADD